jgi:hypothetical protein
MREVKTVDEKHSTLMFYVVLEQIASMPNASPSFIYLANSPHVPSYLHTHCARRLPVTQSEGIILTSQGKTEIGPIRREHQRKLSVNRYH